MSWINSTALQELGVDASRAEEISPFVTLFAVPGDGASELWNRLKDRAFEIGGWPVIVGDAEKVKKLKRQLLKYPPPAEVISAAPNASAPIAVRSRARELAQKKLEFLRQLNAPQIIIENAERMARQPDEQGRSSISTFESWPHESPVKPFLLASALELLSRRPLQECFLAIVKTQVPAEAPAYLAFGGWNACPDASVHVAVLRDWQRRYGAVPAAITFDVIELYLPHPITDRKEALRIADEQHEYCSDLIYQWVGSIEALAQKIWGSPLWYFWWD